MSALDIAGSLELPQPGNSFAQDAHRLSRTLQANFHLTGLGLIRAFTALHFWHGT